MALPRGLKANFMGTGGVGMITLQRQLCTWRTCTPQGQGPFFFVSESPGPISGPGKDEALRNSGQISP